MREAGALLGLTAFQIFLGIGAYLSRSLASPQPDAHDGLVHRGPRGRRVDGLRRRHRPRAFRIPAPALAKRFWRNGSRLNARLHRIDEAADHLADPHEHGHRLFLRPARRGELVGVPQSIPLLSLLHTILGTGLIASGTAALNQWYEREADRKMRRTAMRPLPAGKLSARNALLFGVALSVAGFVELVARRQPAFGGIGAFTLASYLFLYTPMKQRTWWSTTVGAFPGAMPPMIGYAAAGGALTAESWVLFAILFLWQFPHFYSIAWMYQEDYARAGIRMLPVVEPDGRSTARQIVLYGIALIPVSLAPEPARHDRPHVP